KGPLLTPAQASCWASHPSSARECCGSVLAVAGEEAPDASHRILDVAHPGQRDHAEVIRPGPVEAGSLHDEELLRTQQVQHEPLVVLDAVHRWVEPREGVERPLRLDTRDTG